MVGAIVKTVLGPFVLRKGSRVAVIAFYLLPASESRNS